MAISGTQKFTISILAQVSSNGILMNNFFERSVGTAVGRRLDKINLVITLPMEVRLRAPSSREELPFDPGL